MNDLVTLVNEKIVKACSDAGPKCVYVDPSADFDAILGRFCEPGVNEKYYGGTEEGWNREQTCFYEWSTTKDNDEDKEKGDKQKKRDDAAPFGSSSNSTFEGAIANWIKLGQESNGENDINSTEAHLPDGDFTSQGLPDWIGRVFHRTKFANDIVAQNVMNAMAVEQGKIMNQPAVSATVTACPAPTGANTARGIQNSCFRDRPSPDQNTFNLDNGNKAIVDFCNSHKGQLVGSGSSSLGAKLPNGDDKATSIDISLVRDTTPVCQSVPDGGVWSVPECRDNLMGAMNSCKCLKWPFQAVNYQLNTDHQIGDTDTTDKKIGGTRTALCITYGIQGSKTPVKVTTPPKPAAPFETGTCWVHVHQWRKNEGGLGGDSYKGNGAPYSLEVTMYDNKGETAPSIGHADRGDAMDGKPMVLKSKLEDTLVLTPEEAGGEYIQFALGSQSWTSSNNANCKVGDWDGNYDRQMDCSFSCGWGGGKSSDDS